MYDIIIIGAGPAGLTAAIYARRAGKSCLIIERSAFGGQIALSPKLENYPGFVEISGAEFSDRLVEQALGLGAEVELDEVTGIEDLGSSKIVSTSSGSFEARALIIAAGAKHRHLGLDREEELTGMGVGYCAVCDGAFYKGQTVAVYGGGNTALQDAVMLSEICAKVYLIHRRATLRGEKQLEEKLRGKENVEFILEAEIAGLLGGEELEGLSLSHKDGSFSRIAVNGLFIAIGYAPDNAPYAACAALDEGGYIAAGEDCRSTSPGIFAAGDCRSKAVRQVTTAVGDGAVAALAACEYLDSL